LFNDTPEISIAMRNPAWAKNATGQTPDIAEGKPLQAAHRCLT